MKPMVDPIGIIKELVITICQFLKRIFPYLKAPMTIAQAKKLVPVMPPIALKHYHLGLFIFLQHQPYASALPQLVDLVNPPRPAGVIIVTSDKNNVKCLVHIQANDFLMFLKTAHKIRPKPYH